MLLSAKILNKVADVNNFQYVQPLRTTQGNTYRVYFQLVDLSNLDCDGNARRYVPEDGATLEVTFENIDDDVQVTRAAQIAFDGDDSIWYVPITANDALRGTVNMRLVLSETDDTYGSLQAALAIQPTQGF